MNGQEMPAGRFALVSYGFRILIFQRCHMHPTNCLNCGTMLTADDNFCPVCGQKTDTHRISFSHIFHEFFHTLTHADKGVLALLRDLAVKPGMVAAEYIAGKRKKYFH